MYNGSYTVTSFAWIYPVGGKSETSSMTVPNHQF